MNSRRLLLGALVVLALALPATVEAQVIQYFMIPTQQIGNYRGPSYLKWRFNPEGLDVLWSCKDYGSINIMVCAVDADQADLDTLAAQPDVYAWPTALDENLPQAERSAVTDYLEAVFVPANWISPSDTRRSALRTITGMFLYMQRLTALSGESPLDWGITLNTQYRNLTLEQQAWLEQAALDLGYTWDVADNDTIRNVLKAMADAWGEQDIMFGFTTL